MQLQDAVQLISGADLSPEPGQTWLDLGCGSGLFSRAIAELLPAHSTVTGIDRKEQQPEILLPNGNAVRFWQADFVTDELPFKNVDGILMANSLHYVQDKPALIRKLLLLMAKDPVFVIVEYDTEKPNPWVPFPISFSNLRSLFQSTGFSQVARTGERASTYNARKMYASSIKF